MQYDRALVVVSALVALAGCSAPAAPEDAVDSQASELARPGSGRPTAADIAAAPIRPVTGPVSLVSGQSIRLSAVQPVLSGRRGAIPPGPCRVQLAFFDVAGAAVASSRVEVAPGSSQHLDFDASSLSRAAGGRVLLVPAVAPIAIGNPDFQPACLYTVEVLNTETGRTSLATTPALLREVGNPDFFRAIGNPDLRPGALEFGFTGLVTGQSARLNFVNRSGGHGVPPGPCRANVAFVDLAGAHLLDSELDLAPQHGTSFELSASRVNANGAAAAVASIRPVISTIGNPDLRPGSNEYPGMRPGSCLASFEVADQPGGASALRQDPAVIFDEQDTEL